MDAKERIADDILRGAAEIAQELGVTERAVYMYVARKKLPIGRWGGQLIAFRSELRRALERATAKA